MTAAWIPSASSAAPDPKDAKAYVDEIYRAVAGPFNFRKMRYAPPLRALIDKDARRAGDGVGLIEAVPFCECQDTAPNYGFTSTVAATGPGKATVTVLLRNGGSPQTFKVDLTYGATGWAIADIHAPATPSLLAYLKKNLPG
jgi:hypothetical protein